MSDEHRRPGDGGMRVVGNLLLIGALLWGAGWCLWPIKVSIFGFSGSCGPGLFAAMNHGSDMETAGCTSTGQQHVFVAVVGFFVLLIIGGFVRGSAGRGMPVYREPHPVPQTWIPPTPPPAPSPALTSTAPRARPSNWKIATVALATTLAVLVGLGVGHVWPFDRTVTGAAYSTGTANPTQVPADGGNHTAPAPGSIYGEQVGYGRLILGMSFQQAASTGMLAGSEPDFTKQCEQDPLAADWNNSDPNTGYVAWNRDNSLSTIAFDQTMRTSDGIKIGSTFDQVRAAYGTHLGYREVAGDQMTQVHVGVTDNISYQIDITQFDDVYAIYLTDSQCPTGYVTAGPNGN